MCVVILESPKELVVHHISSRHLRRTSTVRKYIRYLVAYVMHMPDRQTTSVSQTWMGRPPVSTALNGTPSMMQLGSVLPSCLFLHLDLVPTLPVRRNVARVHMPLGPHPRLQTVSVGQLQVIVPLQVHRYLRPAFPRQQSLQRLQ
jgi:hypothetical protein